MKDIPEDVKFLSSHEWARLEENGMVTVGISHYAQDLLGDIVFVELPEISLKVNQKDEIAVVESVKAASEVYSPLGGQVSEVNELLQGSPEIINSSPYDEGWFFKLKPTDINEFDNLLSPLEYEEICED